jgi:hypothetical protein
VARALAVASAVLLAALALAIAAGAAVDQATFTPNRGAAGVKLGMTRAAVLAHLGQPLVASAFGALSYASGNRIFDVYLDQQQPKRVRMLGISGRNYCTSGGICTRRPGSVGKLKARYGSQLVQKTNDDGLRCYQLLGTFGGKPVFTSFTVDGFKATSRILMVFILYGSGDVC